MQIIAQPQKEKGLVLDPYIVKATSGVTAEQIVDAFHRLYPDWDRLVDEDVLLVGKWLEKLRRKPGLSLSTGRTNSFKGVLTCSLLHVLDVEMPKTVRTRMDLAWAILDSTKARQVLGYVRELEAERKLCQRWLGLADLPPLCQEGDRNGS